MGITLRVISSNQAQSETLTTLGFDVNSYLLNSSEVLASAIRRAASFLCPCSARSIISAVINPLKYMVEDNDDLPTTTENVLEEMIAIGDLQECRNVAFNRTALLYLAPPSYVRLSGGTIILLGIAPDNVSFLPEEIQRNIVYKGCLRYLKKEPPCVTIDSRVSAQNIKGEIEEYIITMPHQVDTSLGKVSAESPVGRSLLGKVVGENVEISTPSGIRTLKIVQVLSLKNEGDDDLASSLSQLGLISYSEENWLKAPPNETASQFISKFDRSLDRIATCGDITGVTIVTPSKDVRYYRGRWSSPKNISGRFIGRRPQAYGNDIWCYLEIADGRVNKFVDLPLDSSTGSRGCDEAWRIQAAIDAQCGQPQQYRLRKMPDETFAVDLFSPIPCWIERRWNWIGQRIENKGSLLSFQFEEADIEQELDFVRRKLWLTESME